MTEPLAVAAPAEGRDRAPVDLPVPRSGERLAPLEMVWEQSHVTATRVGRTVSGLSWHRCGDEVEIELAAGPGRSAEADVVSELLAAALVHLAGAGARLVHLTLIAGQPQTPALLQVLQRQRPWTTPSPTDDLLVTGMRMHVAGHSALVDLVLPARAEPAWGAEANQT